MNTDYEPNDISGTREEIAFTLTIFRVLGDSPRGKVVS